MPLACRQAHLVVPLVVLLPLEIKASEIPRVVSEMQTRHLAPLPHHWVCLQGQDSVKVGLACLQDQGLAKALASLDLAQALQIPLEIPQDTPLGLVSLMDSANLVDLVNLADSANLDSANPDLVSLRPDSVNLDLVNLHSASLLLDLANPILVNPDLASPPPTNLQTPLLHPSTKLKIKILHRTNSSTPPPMTWARKQKKRSMLLNSFSDWYQRRPQPNRYADRQP